MQSHRDLSSTLTSKLLDTEKIVVLYGTTPPRKNADEERVHRAATRLAQRTEYLQIDGIVVYDVQDESSRTQEPRPFPFLPTQDSRIYSQIIQEYSGRETITYHCVASKSESEWEKWLDETQASYDVHLLSLVGRASSRQNDRRIPLIQAIQQASKRTALIIGGVVIPERHSLGRSESHNLIKKAEAGCSYFISQAIYNPEPVIKLLQDYAADCDQQGISPKRILLTFTPCARIETIQFMKWLGIAISHSTEHTILSAFVPIQESIRVCKDNLQRILEAAPPSVPLGLNIESVSIRKEEIEGSIDLLKALQTIMGL